MLGTEGSGTYMMAEALVVAGCYYTSAGDVQGILETVNEPEVVIRRSLPHAGQWLDYQEIYNEIWRTKYQVVPIFIFREPNATVQSVMRRSTLPRSRAEYQQTLALQELSRLSSVKNPILVTYEALVGSVGFREWLFVQRLGLKYPNNYEFYDGNAKYYG